MNPRKPLSARALPLALILATALPAGPLPAAAADATAAAELRLEQKLLVLDLVDYRESRKREGEAEEQRRAAVERLDQALAGDSVSLGTVETLHQAVAAADSSVRLAQARLERVLARLEDRLRRVSFLEREGEAAAGATRPAGARDIAGTWRMEIQPQGGVATLTLSRNGTAVTGRLVLAGSSPSEVRGTFSNDGLRFERRNARGEVEATFLGTLDAGGSLSGEWRTGGSSGSQPASGSWRAERMSTTG